MKILQFTMSPLQTNTYLVINDGEAFVVDPGGDADKIALTAKESGAKIVAILLTHAHFDHIMGVAEILRIVEKECGSAPIVFLHSEDADKISSYKNLAFSMNTQVEKFTPDVLLKGGEQLSVAGCKIKVLHTPGHSQGGVCYIMGNKIFVGDTLFFMSYGRTDFYDGDYNQLKNSIVNKLFRLEGNYTLLCGHGEPTTLEFERNNNEILSQRAFFPLTD